MLRLFNTVLIAMFVFEEWKGNFFYGALYLELRR